MTSAVRWLETAGLGVLEKDGGNIFVLDAGKVNEQLLAQGINTGQRVYSEFSIKWVRDNSIWVGNDFQMVTLPGGVSAGASGGNGKIRGRALGLACFIAHFAFKMVDQGVVPCPNWKTDPVLLEMVQAASNAVNSLLLGNDIIWTGRSNLHLHG